MRLVPLGKEDDTNHICTCLLDKVRLLCTLPQTTPRKPLTKEEGLFSVFFLCQGPRGTNYTRDSTGDIKNVDKTMTGLLLRLCVSSRVLDIQYSLRLGSVRNGSSRNEYLKNNIHNCVTKGILNLSKLSLKRQGTSSSLSLTI